MIFVGMVLQLKLTGATRMFSTVDGVYAHAAIMEAITAIITSREI